MVTINSLKPNLDSDEEKTFLYALNELLRLSEEKEMHRQWIGEKVYICISIGLLGWNKPLIMNKMVSLLCILIKDNNHNKVNIAEVDCAIDFIIHSLTHDIGKGMKVMELILELSKYMAVCE